MVSVAPIPVMILGCGRSGTSIFGELFDGLAGYSYLSEPPFAEVIGTDFTRPQAFKVPRESEDFPAKPGLSFPVDVLLAAAPSTKFFWIVRNPVDAVCSLRVGIADNWGHHPRPPDWRSWKDKPLIEQCAHHWAFLNEAGFAQIEDRAMLVRFEKMIAEPRAFASSICAAIGVDAKLEEAVIGKWAARVQNANNGSFVEADTSRRRSRNDHTVRVGRWRENLAKDEVDRIWPIVSRCAKRFGYPRPD